MPPGDCTRYSAVVSFSYWTLSLYMYFDIDPDVLIIKIIRKNKKIVYFIPAKLEVKVSFMRSSVL